MEKLKHMKMERVVRLPKIKKQIQTSSTWINHTGSAQKNEVLQSWIQSIIKACFQMSGKSQTIGDFTVSKLSQVLPTNENSKSQISPIDPRQSEILLFPNCPRFCRLMKTRNRRYPRSSGMDGDKSGESGAFLFSRRVPDFCDGRWSFPTNENSNLYPRGRRRWISLITNPLNCWAPVPQIGTDFWRLSDISAKSGMFGKK